MKDIAQLVQLAALSVASSAPASARLMARSAFGRIIIGTMAAGATGVTAIVTAIDGLMSSALDRCLNLLTPKPRPDVFAATA